MATDAGENAVNEGPEAKAQQLAATAPAAPTEEPDAPKASPVTQAPALSPQVAERVAKAKAEAEAKKKAKADVEAKPKAKSNGDGKGGSD